MLLQQCDHLGVGLELRRDVHPQNLNIGRRLPKVESDDRELPEVGATLENGGTVDLNRE